MSGSFSCILIVEFDEEGLFDNGEEEEDEEEEE
jgi:hypothetical protein